MRNVCHDTSPDFFLDYVVPSVAFLRDLVLGLRHPRPNRLHGVEIMPEWVSELMLSEPIRQWLKYEKDVEEEMEANGSVRLEDICDWCVGYPCQCSQVLETELMGAPDASSF